MELTSSTNTSKQGRQNNRRIRSSLFRNSFFLVCKMRFKKQRGGFNNLPPELISEVSQHLDDASLSRVRASSRTHRRMTDLLNTRRETERHASDSGAPGQFADNFSLVCENSQSRQDILQFILTQFPSEYRANGAYYNSDIQFASQLCEIFSNSLFVIDSGIDFEWMRPCSAPAYLLAFAEAARRPWRPILRNLLIIGSLTLQLLSNQLTQSSTRIDSDSFTQMSTIFFALKCGLDEHGGLFRRRLA